MQNFIDSSFADRVRQARKARKLTQEQLGLLSHTSGKSVYRVEHNLPVSWDIAVAIADALKIPLKIATESVQDQDQLSKVESLLREALNATNKALTLLKPGAPQ